MTYNEMDVRIGERIRSQRKRIGLSQKKLASQLDIVFQQLQKHENGTSRVPASRLYEIARALHTPISYFFEHDERSLPKATSKLSEISAMITAGKGKMPQQVLDLVSAFTKIKDEDARRNILSLVSNLAKSKSKQ